MLHVENAVEKFYFVSYFLILITCRAKQAGRFGGARSHVYVLPARQSTVARPKGITVVCLSLDVQFSLSASICFFLPRNHKLGKVQIWC